MNRCLHSDIETVDCLPSVLRHWPELFSPKGDLHFNKVCQVLITTLKHTPAAKDLAAGAFYGKGVLAQCANLSIETALVTRSLVLVDQTLAGHMIKNWSCFFQRSVSSTFIARSDSCENTLYHCAHHRALACVALSRFFGLANAFACLGSIGHGLSSSLSVQNSAAHYPPGLPPRQCLGQ